MLPSLYIKPSLKGDDMARCVSLLKTIPLVFAFAIAALMCTFAAPHSAYADPISFQETSYTMTGEDETNAWFFTKDGSVSIASATSSDESVAIVSRIDGGILVVEPVGEGTAIITVTGTDSSTTTVEVIVTKTYLNKRLRNSTSVWAYWYGSKSVEIDSQAGAKGTLTVGKDKY